MDAVAGARRTPGRLETGGVPPKPPATILLSLSPSMFCSLCQKRCGVILASCCGSGNQVLYRRRGVLLPGSAIRDGCTHVLGLRIIVPEALRRPFGQLLWQRQCSPPQTLRRLFRQLLRQRQSLVDLSILALISRYLLCSFTRSVREFFAWAALYGRCGVPSADC